MQVGEGCWVMAGRDCLDCVVWAERGIGDGAASVGGVREGNGQRRS